MFVCIYTFISQSEIMKLAVDLSYVFALLWRQNLSTSLRNTARGVTAQVFLFDLEMVSFCRRASVALREPKHAYCMSVMSIITA